MTLKHVFEVEDKHKKDLDKALSEDPYSDDSFVKTGYSLRASNSVGLKGGFTVLYFKTADEGIAKKLKERLAKVPTIKELSGSEKEGVIQKLEADEEAAASGFGQIFGE